MRDANAGLPCLCLCLIGLLSAGNLSAQVLHDNGPLVTALGDAPDGANTSAVQLGVNQTVTGYAAAPAGGTWVADDFAVPAPGWRVQGIVLFAYQSGASASAATIDAARVRIWDGPPSSPGSLVVFEFESSSEGPITATSANVYRIVGARRDDMRRPVFEIGLNAPSLTLAPGNYWLQWQLSGTLESGPFVPPVTRAGQAGTGNALQQRGDTWRALPGTGTGEELPFRLLGNALPDLIFADGFEP